MLSFLSSELITLSTLYDNFNNINIRYNFTAVEIKKDPKINWINYLDIRLCRYRHQKITSNEIVSINGLTSDELTLLKEYNIKCNYRK